MIEKTFRVKLRSCTIYVLLSMLILSTDTVWARNYDNWFNVTLIISIILILISPKIMKNSNRKMLFLTLILIGIIILSMMINNDFTGRNQRLIVLIVSSYLLCRKINFENFALSYLKIIFYLALISLIFWIFSFFISPSSHFTSVTYRVYEVYLGIYFKLSGVISNSSIFWEPGVYQYYLNIALIFSLFLQEKRKILNITNVILVISVISTFSAAGYVTMTCVFIAYALSLMAKRKRIYVGRGIAIFYSLILLSVFAFIKSDLYIWSTFLAKFSMNNVSMINRVNSFISPIVVGFQNILLGIGLGNVHNNFFQYSTYGNFQFAHLTSTIPILFASYGGIYASIVVITWFGFPKLFTKNNSVRFFVFAALLVIQNSQNLSLSFLMNVMFFYSFEALNSRKCLNKKYK